jgi:hypothetical protein
MFSDGTGIWSFGGLYAIHMYEINYTFVLRKEIFNIYIGSLRLITIKLYDSLFKNSYENKFMLYSKYRIRIA